MLIPGLISAEACLVGLVVLSLIGFGILAWWDREGRSRPAVAAAASKLATTALQLDSQATAVLELVRTYLDAGERYSVTLAQAGKNLPTSASPDEIGIIVKFLLAENAKMQHEAGELKKSLEKSKSQIELTRPCRETKFNSLATFLRVSRRLFPTLASFCEYWWDWQQ